MPFLRREQGVKTISCRIYDPFADSNIIRGHFKRVLSEIRNIQRKKNNEYPLTNDDIVNVEIRDREEVLRLKMQNENFYVIGYQRREGELWEMREANEQKIKLSDALALGFNEGYTRLEELNLSYWAFCESVKELIRNERPNRAHNTIRKSLFQIVMMLIESSRFHWFEEFYTQVIRRMDTNVPFMPWMSVMVNNWSILTEKASSWKKGRVFLNRQEQYFKRTRNTNELFRSIRMCSDCVRAPCWPKHP